MSDFVIENGTLTKYNGAGGAVTIPSGVTAIGEAAFYECKALTSVVIPDGVVAIKKDAFRACTSLTSVTLPEGVEVIGYQAFEYCYTLASVSLPSSLKTLDTYAFNDCRTLTSVAVPFSITKIGDYAFTGCNSLTSVTISERYKNRFSNIFGDRVSEITLECNFMIKDGVLVQYEGKDSAVIIPEGVTAIGDGAFRGCTALSSVTLPEGVVYIGDSAFGDCTALTDLTVPESVAYLGESAFEGCTALSSVVIPMRFQGVRLARIFGEELADRYIYFYTGEEKPALEIVDGVLVWYHGTEEKVVVPDGVTAIGPSAFMGCTMLTSLNLPNSVTSIGDFAFCGCDALTAAVLPKRFAGELVRLCGEELAERDAFVFMGEDADYEIADGTLVRYRGEGGRVGLPAGLTAIGAGAFKNCAAMTSVKLPDSVRSIGREAFAWCRALTSVTLPEGVEAVEDGAFYVCTSLTEVTLPESTVSVGNAAFAGCAKLPAITLPIGVTTVGNEAFRGCVALTEVSAKGVESIGNMAFAGCALLTDVAVTGMLKSIGVRAFAQCASLSAFTVPASVETLRTGAFERCPALLSLTLPSRFEGSIATILGNDPPENMTIEYGNSLADTPAVEFPPEFSVEGGVLLTYVGSEREVVLPEGIAAIDGDAFAQEGGESTVSSVYIPATVTDIAEATFADLPYLAEIRVAEENPAYRSYNGALYTKDLSVLLQYPVANRNNSYTAPEALRRVGSGAFYECRELHYVNLGGVESIGDHAFYGCLHLFSLTANAESIEVGEDTFCECTRLERVSAPALTARKETVFPDSRV